MQVKSATDPPKKLALGERAIMADGGEYVALIEGKGDPIEIVYPAEGTPLIVGSNAVSKNAPNPNAARLLQNYMFTAEGQQVLIDTAGMDSVHSRTKEKPGRKSLSQIKLMKDDRSRSNAKASRSRSAIRKSSKSEVTHERAIFAARCAQGLERARSHEFATRSARRPLRPKRCGRR